MEIDAFAVVCLTLTCCIVTFCFSYLWFCGVRANDAATWAGNAFNSSLATMERGDVREAATLCLVAKGLCVEYHFRRGELVSVGGWDMHAGIKEKNDNLCEEINKACNIELVGALMNKYD